MKIHLHEVILLAPDHIKRAELEEQCLCRMLVKLKLHFGKGVLFKSLTLARKAAVYYLQCRVLKRGYLFPATSSTCSSVASASSAGSLPRRLSLNERTLRLAQPPSSLGTLPKRLRSTFRLVSFFSLPSERGSDFEGVRREPLIISENDNDA